MKAVYIRCSTLEQTPELQLRDIEEFSGKEYVEFTENQSAWSDNKKRPKFEELKALIKKNKVEDLYIWNLDRLHRNRKRLVEFMVLCKAFNCKIHSATQPWLEQINTIPAPWNEIMHDLLINIMGWMAEDESDKKSARVKLAIRKTDEGTFSYNGNKWGRKGLPNQTITKIKELRKQGLSVSKITEKVKCYSEDPSNGKQIARSTVGRVVRELAMAEQQ